MLCRLISVGRARFVDTSASPKACDKALVTSMEVGHNPAAATQRRSGSITALPVDKVSSA